MKQRERRQARTRYVVMGVVGAVVAAIVVVVGQYGIAAAAGWSAACIVYLIWIWATIGRMDAPTTKAHAYREDPTRTMSEVLLVLASLASLVVTVFVLVLTSGEGGAESDILGGVAILSVVLSWFLIHTLYTLRYAVLFYSGRQGGIDFNQVEPPAYGDFAYLAFTIGMTFQVSDTNISTSAIRMAAIRHALLAYLFGAVILATLVNLVAGFTF